MDPFAGTLRDNPILLDDNAESIEISFNEESCSGIGKSPCEMSNVTSASTLHQESIVQLHVTSMWYPVLE